MYLAITDWKSGHTGEALAQTMAFLQLLSKIVGADKSLYGYANDPTPQNLILYSLFGNFPHICIMGNVARMLYDNGQIGLAVQMRHHISNICKVMSPEFDFVSSIIATIVQST